VTLHTRVLDALATVHDPELDEPITDLRFITSCNITPQGDVEIRLRLPTPQCAPNFAYLMAADARTAASTHPTRGVSHAQPLASDQNFRPRVLERRYALTNPKELAPC
jgi:metal-sulfur cluster biosynthetic enzyme